MKNTEVGGTARRIRSDEIDIWHASPKEVSESNCEEWVQEEKAWVASFNIPVRNLFIFEKGGKFPGKLCFIEENNDRILFAMPAIKSSSDCKYIALELFRIAIAEARKRNVRRLETFLDDCNNPYEILREALVEAGFCVSKHKVLYDRSLEKPLLHKADKSLTYASVTKLGVETVKELFLRSLSGSLENVDALFTQTPDEEFKAIWGSRQQRRKLWRVAFHKHEPVGLVFPDIVEEETGTLVYLAVLPEFRGRGFGDLLFVDGLNVLRAQGAQEYLDSTNVLNYPTIKILERNGCKKIIARMEFVCLIRDDAL